ncbi:MAG: zinc ribbon domain-containing protein [Reyranella sp.]|nr:zinc ribbon domain-containing protein [Reyranella sp.]
MLEVGPYRIDHDTEAYWEGLSERELRLTRCRDCDHWIHPPRGCCPACWSGNIVHDVPSGKATLFSYLVQPVSPGGPAVVVGWAELVEQRRLLIVAPIEGVSAETVEIGSALTLAWSKADGRYLPVFQGPQ